MTEKELRQKIEIECNIDYIPAYWKSRHIITLIKEAGYVKLADIDYKYLPVKETYCYDNGWRKVELGGLNHEERQGNMSNLP